MSLSKYLIVMVIGTLASLACFAVSILVIDPFSTNWLGMTLFYASLMVSVTGLAAIIGFIFLLAEQLFSWLNVVLLIIGFTSLELFLISLSLSRNE